LSEGQGPSALHSAYTETWFQGIPAQAGSSAAVVAPLLCELFEPSSVVDVGCGTGAWLAEFLRNGVADVRGLDGPWVDPGQLSIEPACFEAADLSNPPKANRRFDLVTSLEVAEHLPESSARRFVEYLTSLGDTVAFSAAIPFQGGTDHLNEQWPDYWSDLFAERGYLALDVLRPKIWLSSNVEFWYRQNLIVYMAEDRVAQCPYEPTGAVLPLVHPDLFVDQASSSPARRSLERLRAGLRLRTRLRNGRNRLYRRA
jgi:SAM-dependent methyltransferase